MLTRGDLLRWEELFTRLGHQHSGVQRSAGANISLRCDACGWHWTTYVGLAAPTWSFWLSEPRCPMQRVPDVLPDFNAVKAARTGMRFLDEHAAMATLGWNLALAGALTAGGRR